MNSNLLCEEKFNFATPSQVVRAFTYTEYSFDTHSHDFYEMNIVLNGSGIHQIENTKLNVKRGDVFVIPPMVTHAYYDTKHLEVYHILLKKDFIKLHEKQSISVPGYLQLFELEPLLRPNFSKPFFLHLNQTQISEIVNDFKFIEDNSEFADEKYAPLRENTALKIIYYFSFIFYKQLSNNSKPTNQKYANQILDTLEYINYHLAEKLTIDLLAERVYLSRSTFLRSFKAVCGYSPMQYLNQCRIKKATELIESSTIQKTQIALSCGFYDLSHMEKQLKGAIHQTNHKTF